MMRVESLVFGVVACFLSGLVFAGSSSAFVGRSHKSEAEAVVRRQRTRLLLQTDNTIDAEAFWTKTKTTTTTKTKADPVHLDKLDATTAASSSASTLTTSLVRSVNYFISRKCNFACEFCFHTQKTTHHLTLAQASLGLKLLKQAGCEKINFAGGEPFLQANLLGELCRISHELGFAVSIISNGSLITEKWMQNYGQYVDVLGVSVDSFVPTTNVAIGRRRRGSSSASSSSVVDATRRLYAVRDMCWKHSIKFKMNTVVCSLNWHEDMSEHVARLRPDRWKIFQVLILEQENAGGPGDLRDARYLQVSKDQFCSFIDRHQQHPFASKVLIPEPNDVMQNSYLLLDEDMRFLDCSNGAKIPGESILKVGVEKALMQAGFDHSMFVHRGGVYDWSRERSSS